MAVAIALTPHTAFTTWSFVESFILVGPAALVYAARSLFKQAAYRRCDGVTFNVINQMKVVFCAIAAWFLIREEQSARQCLALFFAVLAGALLVVPDSGLASPATKQRDTPGVKVEDKAAQTPASKQDAQTSCSLRKDVGTDADEATAKDSAQGIAVDLRSGALFALATATCSGLGAALSQVALSRSARSSTLFNFELSLWGAPFAVVAGGTALPSQLLRGWRLVTLAPVALQALGGLLVSRVVQQQGGVTMGLCTVAGIGVSAIVDAFLTGRLPRLRQIVASSLAVMSIAVHQFDQAQQVNGAK